MTREQMITTLELLGYRPYTMRATGSRFSFFATVGKPETLPNPIDWEYYPSEWVHVPDSTLELFYGQEMS